MSIRSFIENLLSGDHEPTEPAKSFLGPDVERLRAEHAKATEFEIMKEKDRGLRGM